MKKSTIYDVAKIAGVSPSTVSRVMNSPEIVAVDTRQKVVNAVREKDYLSALKKAHVNWKKELTADFRLDTAYHKIIYYWPQAKNSDELPTAIFAANDLMAIGALKAFAHLNVRVPEDISIIGFDNIPFSDCTYPPLTTIAQPTYLMGQRAVETLLKLIDKKKIKKSVEFETELIERDSVSRWEV